MTTGRRLARNSALNLVGHLAPLVIALAAIPPLIRGLGPERFGVLTLAWAAIGYFSVFEFGLARALTQHVAQRLGNDASTELSGTVRAALVFLLLSGTAGGLALAAGAGFLVNDVLEISSPTLRSEAVVSFWILAAALPFVLLTSALRGIVEAHQHFGIATALRVPSALVSYVGPLCALPFSGSLVSAVSVIAIGRVLSFALHVVICARSYPYLRERSNIHQESVTGLMRFGAWMTVSNVVSPIMSYLDRFFVAAAIGLVAVTAYATPHEAVTKLLVIPAAFTGAAFPALASLIAQDRASADIMYQRSMRGILLLMFPIALSVIVFAHEGLQHWVGALLPADSVVVLQWLALGVFVTSIGQVPATLLQSAGRPDLIARVHLIELPVYAAMLMLLAPRLGLTGIAIAWTVRCAMDAAALLWLAYRKLGIVPFARAADALFLAGMLSLFFLGAALPGTASRVAFIVVVAVALGPLAWAKLLTPGERVTLRSWLRSDLARASRVQN